MRSINTDHSSAASKLRAVANLVLLILLKTFIFFASDSEGKYIIEDFIIYKTSALKLSRNYTSQPFQRQHLIEQRINE